MAILMLEYHKDLDVDPNAPEPSTGVHRLSSSNVSAVPKIPPRRQKSLEYVHFATLCWLIYLEGWNDGTVGPLLPRIQRAYEVGYAVVSLIFVFAWLGFFIGALLNIVLTEKLAFGKLMVMGSLISIVAYSIECTAPPFPVFVFATFLSGVGLAIQNAQAIGYVASFQNAEVKMGILMAAYGGGALSAPLAATQFSQLNRWSFHYITSIGIALVNTLAVTIVFRLERQQECLARIGVSMPSESKQPNERNHFRQIFTLKDVHFLTCFVLSYVGAEVTMGGWMTTYIIDVRGGGTSSGYVSTGFWGGLMVGRIGLLWVNQKIGERLALFGYAVCAIGLELVIWFVPSLVGDAVAIAIIGLLMGPMYPTALNHCSRVVPHSLLSGAVGWIAGTGKVGSAVVPFLAGAIASKAGITTLQPVLVGILGLMATIWVLIPRNARYPT